MIAYTKGGSAKIGLKIAKLERARMIRVSPGEEILIPKNSGIERFGETQIRSGKSVTIGAVWDGCIIVHNQKGVFCYYYKG